MYNLKKKNQGSDGRIWWHLLLHRKRRMPWLRLVSGSHSSHIDLASLCRCTLQQLWPDGLDSITMSEHSPFFSSHLALHFFLTLNICTQKDASSIALPRHGRMKI